jgi:Inner membrane component of T3SS, cytoplasmic domain
MGPSEQPLRLEASDLYSARVEAYLEEQAVLQRAIPEVEPRPLLVRIFLSSYFYLSLASAAGALTAWAMLEPFFDERTVGEGFDLVHLLLFPTVAGMIGLFLGAAEGLMCRNFSRAAICAVVGLGIGFGGGLVAIFIGGIVFTLSAALAVRFWKNPQPDEMPTGLALLILMVGRATAWAIAALPAGLGQGIALRERKIVFNGLLGAALGGLAGGLLFDPIALAFRNSHSAWLSRAVGFAVIGLMVGLFVGLVEQWTKTAWLLLKTGPLSGKQFILHRNPTVLGSSPKADVYLFKDPAIEPRHVLIHNRGGRFEIEDCDTPDGTYVNGIPVKKRWLQSSDQIVLGKTLLEFVLKDR